MSEAQVRELARRVQQLTSLQSIGEFSTSMEWQVELSVTSGALADAVLEHLDDAAQDALEMRLHE